jgi:hypothetical protein
LLAVDQLPGLFEKLSLLGVRADLLQLVQRKAEVGAVFEGGLAGKY